MLTQHMKTFWQDPMHSARGVGFRQGSTLPAIHELQSGPTPRAS